MIFLHKNLALLIIEYLFNMIDIKHLEDDLNSYSIKELIGWGAFGKVYKAIDNITKEEVAIKVKF